MFRTLQRLAGPMPSTRRICSTSAHMASHSAPLLRIGMLAWCLAAPWAQAQLSDIQPRSPLPDATLNHFYSVRFTPVNPFQGLPVLWSITPGCLAGSGLTFTPQNGVANTARISGQPVQRGTFLCTVVAQDAAENVVAKQYELSIVRACNPPRITSVAPQTPIDPGVPFSYAVTATGRLPHIFSALGLPPGLAIDPDTGVISGTTQASGTYPVTVIVGGCGRSATQSFTLVVGAAGVTLALTSTPDPAVFGQDIAVSVHAAGASAVPTGSVLLCVTGPGEFCAAPVGAPPAGTPSSLIPPLASASLDAAGNAAFTLHGLAIQNYVLRAYYGGDTTHAAATSVPVDQFVIKGAVLPPGSALRGTAAPAPAAAAPEPIPALSPTLLAFLSVAVMVAALRRERRHR
jgi:putative Ig domain-containing protein